MGEVVDLPADAALSFAPPLVGDAATTGAASLSVSCSSSPQFMMAYMCVVVGPVCRSQNAIECSLNLKENLQIFEFDTRLIYILLLCSLQQPSR